MWVVTVICLIGTVLNARKNKLCFYFWAFGNVCWFIYDLKCGLYSRALLDMVQLILGIYGLIMW